MFVLLLAQTLFRALHPGEININPGLRFASSRLRHYLLSQRRQDRQELQFDFVLTPNTFAGFAAWREFICIFLSQRRRGRGELRCLFCCYSEQLCGLARLIYPGIRYAPSRLRHYLLSQRREDRQELQFVLCLPQTPLRALRLGESLSVFFSRRGAEIAENFYVYFVVTPNTFACFAPWRE
jgi:hypothetical protein